MTHRDLGDAIVSTADVATQHSLAVLAAPAAVYRAIIQCDLRESPVIRRLFQLRGMPESATTLEGLQRLGFVLLTAEENAGIDWCVVGPLSGWIRREALKIIKARAEDGTAL